MRSSQIFLQIIIKNKDAKIATMHLHDNINE